MLLYEDIAHGQLLTMTHLASLFYTQDIPLLLFIFSDVIIPFGSCLLSQIKFQYC